MSDLRQDYLTGDWVLFAEERMKRPYSYKRTEKTEDTGTDWCPFCKHNEHMVPGVIYESEDGRVKVVPNKYPAITYPDGYHEVIADTNIHDEAFEDFSVPHMALVFEVLKMRRNELYKDKNIKYVQIFKNRGAAAGASVFHSHCQILGIPFLPQKQQTILKNMTDFYNENGFSYIQWVYNQKELVFYENDSFFLYCPYASIFYKEIHAAPKNNVSNFSQLNPKELEDMADAVIKGLSLYKKDFDDLSYNLCFMDITDNVSKNNFYIQFIPRMGNMAGFEFATGAYINSAYPEKVAENYRNLLKKEAFDA